MKKYIIGIFITLLVGITSVIIYLNIQEQNNESNSIAKEDALIQDNTSEEDKDKTGENSIIKARQERAKKEVTEIDHVIMNTYPELSTERIPNFETVSIEEPIQGWKVVIITPYLWETAKYNTIIIKEDDKGVQRVAFPMYVTQQGISQSDGSDLPVQVINVMIRDAGKYDE